MSAPVGHVTTSPASAGRCTTAGPSSAKAAASASASSLGRDGDDRDAERLDERAEVRLDEVDARRLAELVALVLAEDPVAAVVDEQELRVEPVLARGGELGDPVVEAAVAGDGEHLPAGRGERRAERSRPGVAERPRAERVEEARAARRPGSAPPPSRPGSSCPRRCTASRGSASRMVSQEPELGLGPPLRRSAPSPRRPRAGPSSRGGPGSRSASAASTAFASPTSPSASYVAPIRRGSASTWISRPREAQRVLPGRLGPELRADGEEDVGARRAAPGTPARPAPSRARAGDPRGSAPLPM